MSSHPTNKEKRRDHYYTMVREWMDVEPPCWRIFAWLRWRFSKPKKPEWLVVYEDRRKNRYDRPRV